MSWNKKSTRRRNLFDKGQERIVENEVVIEEVCGNPAAEETAATQESPAASKAEKTAVAEENSAGEKNSTTETDLTGEKNSTAKTDPATEKSFITKEIPAKFSEIGRKLTRVTDGKPPKKYVLTVAAAVTAGIAAIGAVTVLFRRKK